MKLVKCKFATSSIKYLGHIIENNKVRSHNDNLKAIQDFPTPKNRKNIRQFLGKINFYHQYIENATQKLEPFHNLLRKNVPFEWSQECEETFNAIKKYLCSSPILAIFNSNKKIY